MNTESTIPSAAKLIPDLYISIFKQSPVSIAVLNTDFLIIDANPACLSFFGVSCVSDLQKNPPFTKNLVPQQTRALEVFSSKIQIHGKELLHSIVHDVSDKIKASELTSL